MGAGVGCAVYCGVGDGAFGDDDRGICGVAGVEPGAVLSGYVGVIDGGAADGAAGRDCAGGVGTGCGGAALDDGRCVNADGIATGGAGVAVCGGSGIAGDELVCAAAGCCCGLIFQWQRAYNRGMAGVGFLPVEIAEALERGAIVVTGNERAARALRRGWDQRNRAAGLASWAPAAARSWDSWTAALWRELIIAGHATQML